MKEINVLVVEDDPNDVKLMKASISEVKSVLNIIFVENGKKALDFLYRKEDYNRKDPDPDLIILDLNLPLVDGFEVLKIIKEDVKLGLIPIIGFTSSSYDLDITKCYDMGINSYVLKPMDFKNYKKTVSQLINFWVDINQSPSL